MRWRPPRPPLFDLVLAAALLVAGLVESFTVQTDLPPVVHALLTAGVMLTLAWRRSHPLVALAVAFGGIVAGGGPDTPFLLFGAMVIACYTSGLVLDGRRALVGLLVAVGPTGLGTMLDDGEPADLVAVCVLYGGAWVVGRLVREQTRRADDAAERAAALEEADEARRAQAVAEERARIARELHDVISHSISVITVQTQAVRHRLGPEHEREAQDLQAVESTARQAMVELRRPFGVLRADGEKPPLSPQPGLDQLPRLLDRTRAAGLLVELEVVGDPVPLSPGIDLTAYRVVQEALTNAIKHGGAPVAVRLGWEPQTLRIEVADQGRVAVPALANGAATSTGHGLTGMRERVTLYGGRLDVGPRAGGGFAVHAELPLGEAR